MTEGIPGYAEALAADEIGRELAFLVDIPRPLCGGMVRPMALRDMLLLRHAGSPFVCGFTAEPEAADVRQFLWVLSSAFRPGDHAAQSLFVSLVDVDDVPAAVAEIRAFVAETFNDAPGGTVGGAEDREPSTSFVASWVDMMGREYGWTLAETLRAPLPVLYQQQRAILLRTGQKKGFSSRRTARVMGDFQRTLNPPTPVIPPTT